MTFGIGDIKQISIELFGGQRIIYRKDGIERFRKMVIDPKFVKRRPVPSLRADEDSFVELLEAEDALEEVPLKKAKPKKVKTTNGYSVVPLDYGFSGSSDKSPMELAKEMQRQAEASSGMAFK